MEEKQRIEVQPADDGKVIITESTQYAATEMEIRQRINMYNNQKAGLIAESARLKKRYDAITAQCEELEAALKNNFEAAGFVEVNDEQ